MSGGKTVAQLLAEAAAKRALHVAGRAARRASRRSDADLVVLDVREREAYEAGHIPGARHLPRGQLELRVNEELPDPTRADPDLLRVRQDLDAGRGDAARARLHARRRAGRRHEGLARGRLSRSSDRGDRSFSEQLERIDVERPAHLARFRQRLDRGSQRAEKRCSGACARRTAPAAARGSDRPGAPSAPAPGRAARRSAPAAASACSQARGRGTRAPARARPPRRAAPRGARTAASAPARARPAPPPRRRRSPRSTSCCSSGCSGISVWISTSPGRSARRRVRRPARWSARAVRRRGSRCRTGPGRR